MVAEKTENDFRGFLFHLLYIPLQVYALMATTKHDYNTEHETVFLHNVHNSLLKLSFMFAEKKSSSVMHNLKSYCREFATVCIYRVFWL